MKANCWEVKDCGRQPDGPKADALGVCPACTDTEYDGRNGGLHAGRYCWKVAGTLCGDKVQGTFAEKMGNCSACDFFKQVKKEEGADFSA